MFLSMNHHSQSSLYDNTTMIPEQMKFGLSKLDKINSRHDSGFKNFFHLQMYVKPHASSE